tara:strand:+ start:175 stop:531 length:357 start_codon:yes stop_codon:yes gene_type:complete
MAFQQTIKHKSGASVSYWKLHAVNYTGVQLEVVFHGYLTEARRKAGDDFLMTREIRVTLEGPIEIDPEWTDLKHMGYIKAREPLNVKVGVTEPEDPEEAPQPIYENEWKSATDVLEDQ